MVQADTDREEVAERSPKHGGDVKRVFRIQDRDGRGPFKPGMSVKWADEFNDLPLLPTWMDEFGHDAIHRSGHHGEYFGSAVRTMSDLRRWFSCDELRRLDAMGYSIAAMHPGRVLFESENQILIARRRKYSSGCIWIPITVLLGDRPDDPTSDTGSLKQNPNKEG